MANRHIRFNIVGLLVLVGSFLLGFVLCIVLGLQFVPHQQIVGTIVTPIQSAATYIGNAVEDFFAAFGKYREVTEENETLRRELAETKIQLEESYYLSYENENLRGLLSLRETYPEYEFAEANVVSHAADGWSSGMTLDIGSASGIKKGNIVVTGDGLCGVVKDVGLNWAIVTSVIDEDFSAGALVVRTGDAGYTESTVDLRVQGCLKLMSLSLTTMVNRGDTVVTSGYGGRFPKGIVIGTISKLVSDSDGLFVYGVITPAVDLQTVRKVYVVTNFAPEEIEP